MRVPAAARHARDMTSVAQPLPRRARRLLRFDPASRRWLLAWLGGPVIGIVNGVARETLYADRVGDLTAHQISTAVALALFALYFVLLERRRPLPTYRAALAVGAVWRALTVAFEFAFGRWGDGKTWSELVADYNVLRGHLWPVVLAWLALGPAVVRRLHR